MLLLGLEVAEGFVVFLVADRHSIDEHYRVFLQLLQFCHR
jgi:hypothetical protein